MAKISADEYLLCVGYVQSHRTFDLLAASFTEKVEIPKELTDDFITWTE